MKLDVKDLVFGELGHSQKISIELFKEIVEEDLVAERIWGNLGLTRLEQEIMAIFKGTAKVRLFCDRCLGEFTLDVPIELKQLYEIGKKEAEEGALLVERGFQIDLTEPLRQELLVALPTKKICKDDCMGICAKCGSNLNDAKCKCKNKNDK